MPNFENPNKRALSSQEIIGLPQIESYEAFKAEAELLQNFVDEVELGAPGGAVDVYNPEFWGYYQKFVEGKYNESKPLLEGLENNKDRAQVLGYVFSGGARVFSSQEHLALLKRRSAYNAIKNDMDLDDKTLQMLKDCQPLYNRCDPGYGPRNLSEEVFEEYQADQDAKLKLLADNPRFEEIEKYCRESAIYDRLFHAVRWEFMRYYNTEEGKKIADKYGDTYGMSIDSCRAIADSLKQTFSIDTAMSLFSPETKAFLKAHPDQMSRVVDASAEASFNIDAYSSEYMHAILADRNGYSSAVLSIKTT